MVKEPNVMAGQQRTKSNGGKSNRWIKLSVSVCAFCQYLLVPAPSFSCTFQSSAHFLSWHSSLFLFVWACKGPGVWSSPWEGKYLPCRRAETSRSWGVPLVYWYPLVYFCWCWTLNETRSCCSFRCRKAEAVWFEWSVIWGGSNLLNAEWIGQTAPVGCSLVHVRCSSCVYPAWRAIDSKLLLAGAITQVAGLSFLECILVHVCVFNGCFLCLHYTLIVSIFGWFLHVAPTLSPFEIYCCCTWVRSVEVWH